MDKTIKTSALRGQVKAISSKSYAHRMMICAFLSNKRVTLKGVTFSSDILATLSVIKALGANVTTKNDEIIFLGNNKINERAVLNCDESGSTLRFCLSIASALGVRATFSGSDTLMSRPNDYLIECLTSHNVSFNDYKISGKLKGGEYKIKASVSSQYISGLLMALPLLDEDSTLQLEGEIVSSSYLKITLDVLNLCGIIIDKKQEDLYFIKGKQKYNFPDTAVVNGDWSSAAFMLVAGAINNNSVSVSGLKIDEQGDKKIIEILKDFGAKVCQTKDVVCVSFDKNNPFDVDLTNAPDLAPIVSVLGAMSHGKCTIKGVNRLKIKESDRLVGIINMLNNVGVKTCVLDDALEIFGGQKNLTYDATFNGDNDHRMVMSQAILGSVVGATIIGAEAVKKSYPNFFTDFIKLGGIAL